MRKLMKTYTKRCFDAAIDEGKREGYMILVILLDQKSDEQKPMGSAVEVLCSHTNDPQILGAMLKETLNTLTSPVVVDRQN